MSRAEQHLRSMLEAVADQGVAAEEIRVIAHGIQARVRRGPDKGVLRVYDGKRGLRTDLSQVPVGELREILESIQGRSGGKAARGRTAGGPSGAGLPADLSDLASAKAGPTRIGTDESGKGDYFGPLVVAGVLVPAERRAEVEAWGVRDSKTLSDSASRRLAERITEELPVGLWLLEPETYNLRRGTTGNLNLLVAEGHAAVIEEILAKGNACEEALTDKFGDERLVQNALGERGRRLNLVQRVRAESDPAVAAASVVARAIYLDRLDALSETWDVPLHKGAGAPTDRSARAFVRKHGAAALAKVAKLHFKNTQKVLR